MADWKACLAAMVVGPLAGRLQRLVESQEQIATNQLVSSIERQAVLEQLLEATKPSLRRGTEHLHYLLATPFRYPPLAHGSRFGARTEPSLFYGAVTTATVLAEAAYYRFVFLSGMKTAPDGAYLTQHTLFSADYRTMRGLQLQAPPFAARRKVLRDPANYTATQQLGTALREAGVEAFEYASARDPAGGINVALFTPAAFPKSIPTHQAPWLCETTSERVRFYARHGSGIHAYDLKQFLVKGALPQPAV